MRKVMVARGPQHHKQQNAHLIHMEFFFSHIHVYSIYKSLMDRDLIPHLDWPMKIKNWIIKLVNHGYIVQVSTIYDLLSL